MHCPDAEDERHQQRWFGGRCARRIRSPGDVLRRVEARQGVKKRDGNLESCLALVHGHEVDHPPLQFYPQSAQGGRRGEVLAARLSRVTGPGSAAEVGQWHGALLPGLAGPLGILAAFRHTLVRSKVGQGFQQGRRVAFFVAVAQQPSGLHHSVA